MNQYNVKKLIGNTPIRVKVPGSKSITNRALMLAALGSSRCTIEGALFSDDSRAFLNCLVELGFSVDRNEPDQCVTIQGLGGQIPNSSAVINVRSAGTAARFLTVMLAFAGGRYTLDSSAQMRKRPMEPLLTQLRHAGAVITCLEEEGHFPFVIESDRLEIREIAIDTNISSQFASALLMAASILPDGLIVHMEGERSAGSYIQMTLRMLEQFGIKVRQEGSDCVIPKGQTYGRNRYMVEPDMSAACYFFAMAAVLNRRVMVLGTQEQASLQGDRRFLQVLRRLGCHVEQLPEGVEVSGVEHYPGITVNMKDFSDQALTMAALAAFADSPTIIEQIGHIRLQECDRIQAIVTELSRLGVGCRERKELDGIEIVPAPICSAEIETYEDHRVAMAFTLIGLRAGGVVIKNPLCCGKTFENYFAVIDDLYNQ